MLNLNLSNWYSKAILYPTLLLGFSSSLLANNIPEFETTRLRSTAGTGVGSILMDEASILNPAPLSFFNMSSFYFQKSGIDTQVDNGPLAQRNEADSVSFIASDSKGSLNGSVSYQKQTYFQDERKRWGFSFSSPAGKSSALGATLRVTEDNVVNDNNEKIKQKYKQTVFGAIHALNPDLTMGLVFVDPFKVRPNETVALVGFQYLYKDFVSLMFDGGADYNRPLSETILYKGAIQAKVFSDFFIRFGTFNNKGKSEKGSGAGIGWVQPRLVLDFAVKNTKVSKNDTLKLKDEDIKETSFSMSYRF